jgi:putative ABC transport system permease protein
MSGLLPDLRHALRVHAATPVASAIAVTVLAVAMASVTAFLSLYSDLALKPHPGFEASGRLATIVQSDGRRFGGLSFELVERIAEEVTTIAISGIGRFSLMVDPGREQVPVEHTTRGFFTSLRPRLQLGRGFDDRDHVIDAEPVTVISHRFWLEHFGGRADALGQSVRITGRPLIVNFSSEDNPGQPEERTTAFRIVGVMSPALRSTFGSETPTALWLPFERAAPVFVGGADVARRAAFMQGVARLGETTRVAALPTELNARYPNGEEFNIAPGYRIDAAAGLVGDINVKREIERQVALFLAASLLLALVAACNVSLFLLSRAPGRRRELGIRMAVGAPLKRLARQLATEAGLLVAVATVLGLAMSLWLNVFLQDLAFLRQAEWRNVSTLDWRVLAAVAALVLILTALVSLAPVLGLRKLGIAASSRLVAARPGAAQHIASSVQIAVAGALAGAALGFGWYLAALLGGDPGYDTRSLHVVSLETPDGPIRFNTDRDASLVERERRRAAVLALPGVELVGFGGVVPGRVGRMIAARFQPTHDPDRRVQFNVISADSAYIELLDLKLASGQGLDDADTAGMLVNETLARELWGRTDVAGETLPGWLTGSDSTTILGVLEDVSFGHPSADAYAMAWLPVNPLSALDLILIRSRASTANVRAMLQRAIDDGELEIEIANVERLGDITSELIAADRARSLLTVASAALVVALAAFGFYGTQRYLVTAGRREYAIRASVGAGPRALGRLVLSRGILLGLPGLALGGLFAFIVVAWLRDDFLSRAVSPAAVAIAVVAGIVALLIAASTGPARQARRTEPAPLLREE